jgi:24-methylenesterol C-methyltransferase
MSSLAAKLGDATAKLASAFRLGDTSEERSQKLLLYAAAGTVATAGAYLCLTRRDCDGYVRKPTCFGLTGGSIDRDRVLAEWDGYEGAYGAAGSREGIKDRSRTAALVDVFYSLVTDIYEWGWGQSFHFSPKLPGKTWAQSEVAHEARVAVALGLGPGKRALDVGCGVGGPMRTIASVSGAHVTGITINEYQVGRARAHNAKSGLAALTDVVRGNFLDMPFPDASFDAAYAIEATCHAPQLETVFGEVARVLKPGGMFLSYEWVATPAFDPANKEHVRIIDEINFGNGLPEMRTWRQAEEAGAAAGLELVASLDLAGASPGAGPWYGRLQELAWQNRLSHAVVASLDAARVAPKGLRQVHEMLVNVATSLVRGGQTGVFTPMHMLVFRKPPAAGHAEGGGRRGGDGRRSASPSKK